MPDHMQAIASATKRLGDHFETVREKAEASEERLADVEREVKSLKGLRGLVDHYARQLPSLSRDGDGGAVDPHYRGMFGSERLARSFGQFVLAAFHGSSEVRARAASEVVKSGVSIRYKDGSATNSDDFVKAMGGGGADTAGGYLVPDEFVASIIRNVEQYGVARRGLRVVPMSSERQSWPKRRGGLTVYYPDEGAAATPSDLAFGKITMTAKKWAVYSVFSREIEADSAVALGELVAQEIGLALAMAEDTNTFNGDGTSTYAGTVGVMNSPGVAVVTMGLTKDAFTDLALADTLNLLYALPSWVRAMPDCAFYCSAGIVGLLQKLATAQGFPLFSPATEKFPFRMHGYPVIETGVLKGLADSAISTKFMACGSLSRWGFLGQRRGMTLERSAEVKWLEDQVAIKCVPRQDIQEADGTAMAVLRTAAA